VECDRSPCGNNASTKAMEQQDWEAAMPAGASPLDDGAGAISVQHDALRKVIRLKAGRGSAERGSAGKGSFYGA
ncbi:MAG TPA: hypothetical protein VFV92_09440, partial [Candidatus Bathyarchaeia archaeon]|nr:hypothetical protein [Candidatus Bathyarchaeia archaeon]